MNTRSHGLSQRRLESEKRPIVFDMLDSSSARRLLLFGDLDLDHPLQLGCDRGLLACRQVPIGRQVLAQVRARRFRFDGEKRLRLVLTCRLAHGIASA